MVILYHIMVIFLRLLWLFLFAKEGGITYVNSSLSSMLNYCGLFQALVGNPPFCPVVVGSLCRIFSW